MIKKTTILTTLTNVKYKNMQHQQHPSLAAATTTIKAETPHR